jgi:AAHS family 4-hydroxybenzoate transporter-like MFS transporter
MNNIHHTVGSGEVDIGELLDEGPWTTVQRIVVLIAALSIVLDGFDGQLIGYAIPVLLAYLGWLSAALLQALLRIASEEDWP